jgi:hypothetical protein
MRKTAQISCVCVFFPSHNIYFVSFLISISFDDDEDRQICWYDVAGYVSNVIRRRRLIDATHIMESRLIFPSSAARLTQDTGNIIAIKRWNNMCWWDGEAIRIRNGQNTKTTPAGRQWQLLGNIVRAAAAAREKTKKRWSLSNQMLQRNGRAII